MTEQLSQLYHHAWECAQFENEYKKNPTYEKRSVLALEIFGEFIVMRCAKIALENSNSTLPGNAIKEHFGVK